MKTEIVFKILGYLAGFVTYDLIKMGLKKCKNKTKEDYSKPPLTSENCSTRD